MSLVVIIPIALAYGIFPLFTFDFEVNIIDLKGVFKSIMFLYLGISMIWLLGIFKPRFWEMATITNIVFMGSLGLGRLTSLILDGQPSPIFFYGMVAEIVLAVFAIIQLKRNIT